MAVTYASAPVLDRPRTLREHGLPPLAFEMMSTRKRPLPQAAAIALDVIADIGSREIRLNDFELRMHQRGCGSRAVSDALKAFERRGWHTVASGMLLVTEAAFDVARNGTAQHIRKPTRAKRRRAMPNLF